MIDTSRAEARAIGFSNFRSVTRDRRLDSDLKGRSKGRLLLTVLSAYELKSLPKSARTKSRRFKRFKRGSAIERKGESDYEAGYHGQREGLAPIEERFPSTGRVERRCEATRNTQRKL